MNINHISMSHIIDYMRYIMIVLLNKFEVSGNIVSTPDSNRPRARALL